MKHKASEHTIKCCAACINSLIYLKNKTKQNKESNNKTTKTPETYCYKRHFNLV